MNSLPLGTHNCAAPSLWRRFMAVVYEACLVGFALSFIATYLLLTLLQWQWPLGELRNAVLSAYLFVVYGIYFTYFWSHGGQTLPMKTVEIKLVGMAAEKLSGRRAAWRYLLCWWGLLPGALLISLMPNQHFLAFAVFAASSVFSVLWAKWSPSQQSLHDYWAGTRLILVYRG